MRFSQKQKIGVIIASVMILVLCLLGWRADHPMVVLPWIVLVAVGLAAWLVRVSPGSPCKSRVDNCRSNLAPLDEMMGLMLETWDHRYTFELDRAARKAEFSLGDLKIYAEETSDGMIQVSLKEGERVFTRIGTPAESAKAIESVMFPESGPVCVSARSRSDRKPWWKFWS